MQNKKDKNQTIVDEAIKNFSLLSDADIVIGKPLISPSGITIIPISKVVFAMLSGIGEYGEIKLFQGNKDYPKSTASGGITSVKPVGFLIEKEGEIKYLHCPTDVLEKAFDSVEGWFKSINEK